MNLPVEVLADGDHAYRLDFPIYFFDILVNFTLSKVIACLKFMQAEAYIIAMPGRHLQKSQFMLYTNLTLI